MRRAGWILGVLLNALVIAACDGGDGDKGPVEGKDVSMSEPDASVSEDVVASPDGLSGQEDLTAPREDVEGPFEDLTVPEELVPVPEEDVSVPEEARVVPEEDIVVPKEDVVVPEEDVVVPEEDVVASKGACDNPADLQVFEATPDMGKKVGDCVMGCIGQGVPCWSKCVQDSTGLSAGCSTCFGEVIQCTVDKCMIQCIVPDSPGCADCRAKNCGPSFEACAGVPMS